jgi:hypothetical protein
MEKISAFIVVLIVLFLIILIGKPCLTPLNREKIQSILKAAEPYNLYGSYTDEEEKLASLEEEKYEYELQK